MYVNKRLYEKYTCIEYKYRNIWEITDNKDIWKYISSVIDSFLSLEMKMFYFLDIFMFSTNTHLDNEHNKIRVKYVTI